MPKGLSLIFILLLSLTAHAENWPAEQWSPGPTINGPALRALEQYAFPSRNETTRQGIRTDALLVIRDGQLIYERYAGPTTAETPHLTWSISKSLMATVLGVAYGEGRFKLEDPVGKFYPPLQKHPAISMADLLHWASGLDWQEDYEYAPLKSSVVAMLYTRGHQDMAAFIADHDIYAAPGQAFRYSSGDSNLLSAALKTIVGPNRYADYPWTALFEPLGIRHAVWETDATGTFVASSYAYLTARDLARVGLLMARDGRWGERQLLPKDWVAFNREPFARYHANEDDAVPGGHWWLNRAVDDAPRPWPDAPADTFAALGHWGQAMYVIPSENLVIVRYADDRDDSYRHNQLLNLVRKAFGREGAAMNRRPFVRRRPFSTLLLLLLIALLGWIWQERVALSAFPDIISAYTAKEYCSCRYVMNNDAAYCRGYVKQWLPTSGFTDDTASKRITVNGMGRSNSAAWINEHQGCRLQP